mmetsp:Transcript_21342/g.65101  ORF Transcript_21342/g.65101 Transcript_21342/m.65101 type:complete len:257 (-) Transcript_21342:2816-3586(-)
MQLEEQFGSLQEEVDVKTRKLKKLWAKYQAATSEIRDLEQEFQREREDMLDTIRDLTKQVRLKDLIIGNFVPPLEARAIEARSVWDGEADTWSLPRQDLAGNVLRAERRAGSAAGLLRPETEYARQRKQYDVNPRYKHDNIINMEVDLPESTTQEFEGPGMVSRVNATLSTPLDLPDEDVVFQAVENTLGNPYLHYNPEGASNRERGDDRPQRKERSKHRSGKSSRSSKARPGTASRRKNRDEAKSAKESEDKIYV